MKLKRFISLVVSLSMVLSIVPAFSITVRAADYSSLLAHTTTTTAVFDGSGNSDYVDSNVNNWSGWSATTTNKGRVNLRSYWVADAMRDTLQFYHADWSQNDYQVCETSTATITTPGYGGSKKLMMFQWYHKADTGTNNYDTFTFYDIDGVTIATFTLDVSAAGKFGSVSTEGILLQLLIVNNDDGTHDAVYYNNGTAVTTETSLEGNVNGFGSIFCDYGWWSNRSRHIGFADFQVYACDEPVSSSEATVKGALDSIVIDNSTNGENITLPATVTDIGGTYDVTWISSDETLLTSEGVYAKTTTDISTVTLTPTADFDGTAVTGSAKTVMVFPKSRAGEQYSTGDAYYTIGTNNLIEAAGTAASFEENGTFSLKGWTGDRSDLYDFSEKANGILNGGCDWFIGVTQDKYYINGGTYSSTNYIPDGDWSFGTRWNDNLGVLCTLNTVWAVEPGTYYMSFYAATPNAGTGTKGIYAFYTTGEQQRGSAPPDWSGMQKYEQISTTKDWQKYEYVFDVTESGYIGFFGYNLGGASSTVINNAFDDFELYEMTKLESHTVTLNITGTDGSVVKTLSDVALTGESVSFAAQSFTHNGVFYTTEAKTYTNVTADATYTLAATADTTKIATTNNFSYNFNGGEVWYPTDKGPFTSLPYGSGTISIGWNDFRATIMTFPIPVLEGKVIGNIDLTVNVGYASPDSSSYTVYAIDPQYVVDGTMDPQMTGYTWSTKDSALSALGAVEVGSATVTVGYNTITLDLSNAISITKDGTLALLITSGNQVYTYSAITEYPPYLSSTYTTIDAISYNISYVDESGNDISTEDLATTVDYVPGTQYGYDDEVICPGLAIPTISGYIFNKKSVSGTTITLEYAVDSQDDYFFNNIEDMDTRFVSLNMLGSHDAFTAGVSETRYDAAGITQGNGSAKNAMAFGSLSTSMSVTQDLTATGQLQAGARYFDTRLSRSTTDASYALKTAPHTNGVFYTMHGLLFDEFEPALYSIAQWAATHPGEIIVLDFQEYFDDGDATEQSWKDLYALLTKTGITQFVNYTGNGNDFSIKNLTYGDLTNNGTKAGIVLFGRSVADNVGNFIRRGDTAGAFNGKVYSNYETGLSTTIGSSFSADYIQAQVDYMDEYPTNEDHPIYWMFRVMQAQSESSNLLSKASSDNTSLLTALNENPEWLTALPVVMVNGVGTNTDDIVNLLKGCNVPTVTVNYVNNGTTVYSEVGGLVGTLYTNDGFYDTPVYKLVNDANGEYYVSETFYTTPDNGTITPVISGSTVEVDVTKLGNVYTTRYANVSGGVHKVNDGTLDDDKLYSGINNFAAYTWGTDHDRLGIAILDADADASAYMLKAIEERQDFNASNGGISFYAVPLATYRALDLTDGSSLIALLTSENLVCSKTWGITSRGQHLGTEVTYILDSEKMRAAAAAGEGVVIIGDAQGGLYGFRGEGMEIVSGWSVTTDGTETVVTDGGTYTLPSSAKIYEDEAADLYAPEGVVTIEEDKEFTGYNTLGVDMIQGAQVRIGDGVDSDGKVSTGSGLRFITKVNRTDTIAGLEVTEVGVLIMAEGSTAVVEVPVEQYQDSADTIFTTALTNLAVSNYNRNFTAYPYVKYTDTATGETKAIVGNADGEYVTRSIYQVAAGLLAKGYTADDNGTDYETGDTKYDEVPEVLINVLNAYVNQTGVRLTLSDSTEAGTLTARTEGSGAYTGEAFFEVGKTTYADGKYTVTLTAVGNAKIDTELFNEYVRINNNNSNVSPVTTITDNGNGTYTLVFDYANM